MLAVVLQQAPPGDNQAPVHFFERGCESSVAAASANPLLHFAAKFVPKAELSYTIGLRKGVPDRAGLFDATGPLGDDEEDDEAIKWAGWWWQSGGRHGKPRKKANL